LETYKEDRKAMNDKDMHHIQRVSQRYRLLFTGLIVGVPVFDLLYWAFLNHLPDGLLANLPIVPGRDLSILSLSLACLASLIPVSVAVYGLFTLRSLFRLYENAIIFSVDNVRCFRRLGYTLIAWVIASAVFTPLISIAMTFTNPPGERVLVAKFGVLDFSTLIIGGIVLLVSWVMNEGRKLEDEQAHTI